MPENYARPKTKVRIRAIPIDTELCLLWQIGGSGIVIDLHEIHHSGKGMQHQGYLGLPFIFWGQ